MKVFFEFTVTDSERLHSSHRVYVSHGSFRKIEAFAPNRGRNPNLNCIRVLEKAPELTLIFDLIREETNLVPQKTRNHKCEENAFRCWRFREYEKPDYENAEFFLISCAAEIASYAGRESGYSGHRVVHNDKSYRPQRRFGYFEPNPLMPMVNVEMRDALREAGFSEIGFEEVLTKPPKADGEPDLWRVFSSVRMPPLQNEFIMRLSGDPFTGNPVSWEGLAPDNGVFFVDGPYFPPEPKFRRDEVEAMGDFDIAQMQELIGPSLGTASHPIVISQRFRKFLKSLKISDKNFVPVRLVD